MIKKTSAAQGFVGSLILLVAALVVFFIVMSPRKSEPKTGAEPAPAQAMPPRQKVTAAPQAEPMPLAVAPAAAPAPATGTDPAAESDDPQIQKAINLIDAGNVTEAIAILEAVLKHDPRNEQALVELAMVYLLDLKQPEVATGYLQRVVDVNPQNQIVMSELVSLYEEQGKLDEGLAFLTEVHNRKPDSTELAYGIGQMMTLQGRDGEAISYLEKAAQEPENQVRALKDLGEAYSRTGDTEKAVDSFAKAIGNQEKEIADKQARGLPVQFDEERLNYTKMHMARELVHRGGPDDLDQAQQLLNDVKATMPTDEAVTSLQATLNRRKAG
jgi:MSHA biogenesis protein MshN